MSVESQINTHFHLFKNIIRWYCCALKTPKLESTFWNLVRECNSSNWGKNLLDQFLYDLDKKLGRYTDKKLKNITPYQVFNELCIAKHYCIPGKDVRKGIKATHVCNGLGACGKLRKEKNTIYKDNQLCRIITEEAFIWEYALNSGGGFGRIPKILNRIKNSKFRGNYKTRRRNPIWVTTKEKMNSIRNNSRSGNVPTNIRDSLGLAHIQNSNLIMLEFPKKHFVRKIAKPTCNLSPEIPFKVNLHNKFGRTVHLISASDCLREAVCCPGDINTFFKTYFIGSPKSIALDENLHLEKIKKW